MLAELKKREASGQRLRIGLVGAGAMGCGVALQVQQTPGMEIAFLADKNQSAIDRTLKGIGTTSEEFPTWTDPLQAIAASGGFDVLVESTNCIAPAYRFCLAAMEQGAHVVLMNAEVDLAFSPLLQKAAVENGVICSSDAGDQHGVLMTMIEEIQLWGFHIAQAGNIKGFLNRHATASELAHEAAIRHLDPVQCCAYTDGTKLNIEMALVSNATGLVPAQRGMTGPACADVKEVFDQFDLSALPPEGSVDYILGAEPGGGVYVIGHSDNPLQQRYLEYYKLGDGPYYLFYRPYHLCHLETTRAIVEVAIRGQAVLRPNGRPLSDVYAFAKRDLKRGDAIQHAIGGDECYGLIDTESTARSQRLVPVWVLEGQDGAVPTLVEDVAKDQPITIDDLSFPDTDIHQLWQEQRSFLAGSSFSVVPNRG